MNRDDSSAMACRVVGTISAAAVILLAAIASGSLAVAMPQAATPALPSPPPSTPSSTASPVPDATAELRRRLQKVEQENASLRADLSALRAQVNALAESYSHHYHQVNGEVGNGLIVTDGKTLVSGSYADMDLKRTGGPQPPYTVPLPQPVTPARASKPVAAKKAKMPLKPKPGVVPPK